MLEKYKFNYNYQIRWVSYWHQINEVLSLSPANVLEIGIGSKVVLNYLKQENIDIKTLDINKELNPDYIGSVEKMPLESNSFDVVLCAEVLEHLPFEKFSQCLSELRRVSKKYVVLSLPHFGPPLKFSFKIPFFKEVRKAIKIPFPVQHNFRGDHYWEIGKKKYSKKRIKMILKKYFKIKKDFIPFQNQYHHFYILEK